MYEDKIVLCGANSYEEKYYLNPDFDGLPDYVKDELKIMCVLYTEECGGILTLEFLRDGTLVFRTRVDDYDFYYDEIDPLCQRRLNHAIKFVPVNCRRSGLPLICEYID